MKLVENWKSLWKSLTVQVSAVGFVVTQALFLLPSWDIVPQEVKDAIPPEYLPYVTGFFFLTAMAARYKAQPSLHKPKEDE